MIEEARLPDQLYRFKDPRQRRIYDDLHRLIGPGPAGFYKDACQLMDSPQLLESTTHLVGHLLREIESTIRDVLTPVAQRLASQETQHDEDKASRLKFQEGQEFENLPLEDMNVIVKALQQQGQSAGKFTLEVEFKNLDNDYLTLRIFKEGDTHKQKIRAILKALEIMETDRVALAWLRLVDQRNEYRLHKVAHRDALRRPRPITEEFQRVWEEMQDVLSEVLQRLQDRYLTIFEILDDLLKNPAPAKKDFKMLETAMPQNPVTLDYFFSKCKNPKWLGYLEQRVVKGPLLQSEAHYLAQMAAHHPQIVREIILQTSEIYDPYVVVTLADAMLNMPPDIAAQLVDKAKGWASPSSLDPLLADKLGALITHLAQSGRPEEVLSLAKTLLEILPDPTVKDRPAGGSALGDFAPLPKPKAKLDPWYYEELLKKHVPELVKVAKLNVFRLLCELLDKAIRFSQRRKEDKTDDYSRVWRPAVEEHSQNIKGDLKDALVDSIRDVAELLVREDLAPLPEVVEQLESRTWPIFHRIALHLLRQFPEKTPDLVAGHLMDRSKLDDPNLMHEYALLLRECFKTLTPDQQRAILDWINQGPDLSWMGSDVPAREVEQRKKSWQLRRLTWIKDDLTGEWKELYETLLEELGEPEHPEFPTYMSTGWIGPISPKTTEELQAMSVEEIVEFLRTWQPVGDPRFGPAPEPEGLGREFVKAVSEGPERFAAAAIEFQGLDPTYVRALLSGLHEATKQGKHFDWEPVLGLCQWVIDQPREIVGRTITHFEADPHWGWTRKEVARLLAVGFNKDLINFDLRSRVWEILSPITDDPDPTPEEDESRSGLNSLELAINTTRGEAIDAVIYYALWVRRHLKNLPDGKERAGHGFAEMPGVQEVLEKHLDLEHDPSLAIHSIYGLEFPRLVLLDPKWAKQKASQIFPLGESQRTFWEAAWRAYIVYNQPYSNVFEILHDQYAFAIEHMDLSEEKQRSPEDPDERLAQHLMAFYWWGESELDDPLFSQFWEQAPSSLRKDALGFIGRSLRGTKDEISPEILGRLKHLWERRLELAKQDPEHHKSEITAFGWWFISRRFEDEWAISQLLDVLSIVGRVERDHSVIEQLATLVDRMPLQCIRCLRAIVEGDREGWKIYIAREHVQTILSAALHSSDNKAAEEAKKLINYLGSRGYLKFGNLLKPG